MNWKKIKKQYPKAFELFKNEYHVDIVKGTLMHFAKRQPSEMYFHTYWNEKYRELYDFFDEQGIVIGMTFHHAVGIEKWFVFTITYNLGTKYEEYILTTGIRPKAEQAAFTKAFEILNNRL